MTEKISETTILVNAKVDSQNSANVSNNTVYGNLDGEGIFRDKTCKFNKDVPENKQDDYISQNKTTPKRIFILRSLNKSKKCLLVFCFLAHFMSGLSTSLLAPFYPRIAQQKGMSLSLIGVTFSIFPLINILLSPIFGCYINAIGPKFMAISGLSIGGVCNILYGTLDKCPPGTAFIVTSLMCRLVEGIGFTAYCVSIFTITSVEFSDYATTALSLLQSACYVGLMFGPGIGGFLYDFCGFVTPFYITGLVIILNGMILYKAIPNMETQISMEKGSAFSLLRNGLVLAACASLWASSTGTSFLETTLSNHLAPLHLSTTVIGLLFTIVPALAIATTSVYGFLTDTKGVQSYLIVLGQLVLGLGFFWLGPGLMFPFLQLDFGTIIPGLILVGSSCPACMVPTFKCLFTGALESGWHEDDPAMYAVASSLQNSLYFTGAFTGPLLGNVLIEKLGYRFGYTMMGSCNLAVAGLCWLVFLARRYAAGYRNGYTTE